MDRKSVKELLSIVVLGLALIYLQAALFVELKLPTQSLLVPAWFVDNVRLLGMVGLYISAALVAVLGGLVVPKMLKQPTQAVKITVALAGAAVMASGIKILASGVLISLEGGIGVVFGIVGVNMALRLFNRKLF